MLIVRRKLTIFAYFSLYLRAISKYKPPGTYIRRGDLTKGFLRYEFGGLIFGRAYRWRGLFSEFYGTVTPLIKDGGSDIGHATKPAW